MDAPVQLGLLSSAEMPAEVFSELESRGIYTGARLRAQRPEDYDRCLALLREGVTPLLIEKALGIEHRTVEAVAAAHSIPIQTSKRRMAERFRFAADRALDMVQTATEGKEAKDYMITAGIANQHWQLLAGEPTTRSESLEVRIESSDLNAWIDSAVGRPGPNTPAGPLLEVQATEVPDQKTAASDSESDARRCGAGSEAGEASSCIPEAGEIEGEPGEKWGRGGSGSILAAGDGVDASGNAKFSTKGAES